MSVANLSLHLRVLAKDENGDRLLVSTVAGLCEAAADTLDALNAEVAKLREALEEIVNGLEERMDTDGPPYTIARAALEPGNG